MLLFGATGPLKTPTGTCATAVESLDIACDSIRSRGVKVALVGGTDDLQEELSTEFSNMKATMVAQQEIAKGFLPSQMSRPTASSRAGFVESCRLRRPNCDECRTSPTDGPPHLRRRGYTQMAGDGVGRSVPAPGKGILTAAREAHGASQSPLLDFHYRRSKLEQEFATIEEWRLSQYAGTPDAKSDEIIESEVACRRAHAQWLCGMEISASLIHPSPPCEPR